MAWSFWFLFLGQSSCRYKSTNIVEISLGLPPKRILDSGSYQSKHDPVDGDAINMGSILVGNDPAAIDALVTRLMGHIMVAY